MYGFAGSEDVRTVDPWTRSSNLRVREASALSAPRRHAYTDDEKQQMGAGSCLGRFLLFCPENFMKRWIGTWVAHYFGGRNNGHEGRTFGESLWRIIISVKTFLLDAFVSFD